MFKFFGSRESESESESTKTINALKSIVEHQRQQIIKIENENKTHRDHIIDLGNQNEELRKNKTITPQEEATFRMQAQHIAEMKAQLDELALWLRNNKSAEIRAGKHAGLTLPQTIIMYLSGGVRPEKGDADERTN